MRTAARPEHRRVQPCDRVRPTDRGPPSTPAHNRAMARVMALTATMYRFTIELSDVDRGVYETLELRAAQHPSESAGYLITRVLAWCLEQDRDLVMGRGIAFPDEPALSVTDPTGAIQRWIEVGVPAADRLHRATKAAPSVAIYAHRSIQPLLLDLRQRQIHRQELVDVFIMPQEVLADLERVLSRNSAWSVLRSDGVVYVTVGDMTTSGPLAATTLAALLAPQT